MVEIHHINEIRPRLLGEFEAMPFTPRTEVIAEAYRWGQQLHAGQQRLSGEPYFETHCVWVASLVDRLVANEAWTIAALLHDSVEDRDSSFDAIREHFPGGLGEEVARVVDGVTKLSAPKDGRTREMATLAKIARFRDPGVFLVKLADKTHNMMTVGHMPPEKRRQKAVEAIRAYGKLAGILNCYRWRRFLEDISFPHAEPETYTFVKSRIDSDPRLQPVTINQTMTHLGELMDRAGIDGRVEIIVNGYWQAWQKLRRMARVRKTSLSNFGDLNDLISYRLIVNSNVDSDCYLLLARVNRFLASFLDQDRFDDYIASPQNGYPALQVTGLMPGLGAIEIAIATDEMEGENLWGIVYNIQQGRDISLYRPVEILTPSGGTRFVPEGSTVLDAVASIQQEFLLDKISAIKINDRLAHLWDRVQPGDLVEVVTGGQRLHPTEEWLGHCNASTQRLVQAVLATEALKRQAEEGRQMLRPLLMARGIINLDDVHALEPDRLTNLLERLGCSGVEDLYVAFGGGAIRPTELVDVLNEVGLTCETLQWTTINLEGTAASNRPGVLARLAGLVFNAGGNILRSVNNTLPGGGFELRIVVRHLEAEKHAFLKQAFSECDVSLEWLEIV